MIKTTVGYLWALLLLTLLAACSGVVKVDRQRYFFPPPPNDPKVEYLQSLNSDHDIAPEYMGFMTEHVLGRTRPMSLFSSPVDVASDGKGRVFVTDSALRQVVVLDFNKNIRRFIRTFDSGAGTSTSFGMPLNVSVDKDGNIYIVDVKNESVEVFDAEERHLFSIADPGLARPTAVAADLRHGLIYVVDTAQHRLGIFDMQGSLIGYTGSRGSEPGQFNFPTDIDVDDQGHVYVLDSLNARVQVFDETGTFLRMFGERGGAEGSFSIPKGLAVSNAGYVFVTDALGHKVVIFSLQGEFLLRIGGKAHFKSRVSPGGLYLPRGVDVDDEGGIWLVDGLNRMLHRFQLITPQYLIENPL